VDKISYTIGLLVNKQTLNLLYFRIQH